MAKEKNPPSILISFRLNPHDANFPDDEKALAVYRQWIRGGHKDRHIMTKALLALGGYEVAPPTMDTATRRLMSLANRLERAIEEVKKIDRSEAVYTEGANAGQRVNFDFIGQILGGLTNKAEDGDDDDE